MNVPKTFSPVKTVISLLLLLTPIFGISQVNILIDTLILQARTSEKVIVVENKIGERIEYWYDSKNQLYTTNYSVLENTSESDEETNLRCYSTSSTYKNDSIFTKFYSFTLNQSKAGFTKTLESLDSSVIAISDYQIVDHGDSLTWQSGTSSNHVFKKAAGQITGYSYHFELNDGRILGNNWFVKNENDRTYVIDTSYHRGHIDYDIFILNYAKNGKPQSINKYDWLMATGKQPDIMGYITSKKETKKPIQVFKITYCETGDCVENTSLSSKTIRAFLKYCKKHDGY